MLFSRVPEQYSCYYSQWQWKLINIVKHQFFCDAFSSSPMYLEQTSNEICEVRLFSRDDKLMSTIIITILKSHHKSYFSYVIFWKAFVKAIWEMNLHSFDSIKDYFSIFTMWRFELCDFLYDQNQYTCYRVWWCTLTMPTMLLGTTLIDIRPGRSHAEHVIRITC